ncbi:MAG: ribosomal-processing cysteine protease Prp [Brevinematia bacterium]
MIEVKIKSTKEKITIILKGHSNYSKKGEDIVCAGVSGVLQFLIIHLFNNLKRKGKFSLSHGKGFIEIMKEENDTKIIDSFVEYLEITSKSYPGTISITKFS